VPGGRLWFEHGCDQAEAVARLLSVAGFSGIATQRDLAGLPRCTGGVLESGSTLG
jgi:release factor glutamine methyltransferase